MTRRSRPRRAAIYARVSTLEQTTENQLMELRRYIEQRGWTAREYVDEGVSGSTNSRPALDRLMSDGFKGSSQHDLAGVRVAVR